jgi:dodecin
MIVKVIEIIAQSDKSWESAANIAIKEASKTIKNIKSIYIKEQQALVENNRITQYRITAKISFVIDDTERQKKK